MNKTHYYFFLTLFVVLNFACKASAEKNTGEDENSTKISVDEPWSIRLADSFLERHKGFVTFDEYMERTDWNYQQGVVLEGLRQVYELTGDKKYFDFIKNNIDQYVNDDGVIRTYDMSDFNLDKINTGKQLLFLYKETGEKKYKAAADSLRHQLRLQPRTTNLGFWHKKIYPYQMWLDGLYMAGPFYARYIEMFDIEKDYKDVVRQFMLVYKYTVDEKTGLLYHAWNENKEQKWADPETGRAPHFWGRAIGWYLMAIVDVLDYLPENDPARPELITILNKVSKALLNYRDEKSGLWYQILDQGNREGNYLEASCATMFVYSFAKGANKGYLDENYLQVANDAFEKIIEYHVTIDENGFIDLHHTCAGAGLGGNPYRDGSFEYYINEPQRTNDFKRYGPLIFGAVELEKAGLLK